jgi:hypothetical protein
MSRQAQSKVENNFSRGLVTDVTALQFPPNAATDTDNCVFDFTGRVTRRLGMDLEDDYIQLDGNTGKDVQRTLGTLESYSEYLWEAVAGVEKSFVVIQKGTSLLFFDVSTTASVNDFFDVLDLNDFLPSGSAEDPAAKPCQYASGRGTLVVVNPACDPFFVEYDTTSDEITATTFEIKVRDFAGMDDGLGLTDRPVDSVSGLISSNPEHYYNILNQGWTTTDALSQWDAARTDLPSNADYVAIYRASVTDSFDTARVASLSPLNRPAPKGHFILTATNPDRDAAMIADGFSAAFGVSSELIGGGVGSIIQTDASTATEFFNGSTNRLAVQCGGFTNGGVSYAGKNFSSSPKRIAQAKVYGSNDNGFVAGSNPAMTWSLYAKQTAPASSTDGLLLGTVAFTDTTNESTGRTITSSDTDTFWNYVWVKQNVAGNIFIAEIEFFEVTDTTETPSTTKRPASVAFYSGRLFYAGIEAFSLNNTIFFTPILEKTSQYGECYQLNDPTGEFFFDLLPSDGGTIVIPEMGKVTRLVNCKNALIVVATNGVWSIQGSAGNFFRANDYQIKKITTIGSTSPLSFVDNQGLPVWWGQEGIFSLKFDQSYDAFNLEYLSVGIVDIFFNNIPIENRKYVKGVYSPTDYLIFWMFYDGELGTEKYVYNRALVYDARVKAYYPWTFTSPVGTLDLRGLLYVQAADRIDTPGVKYLVTYEDTIDTDILTFAELNDTVHRDWFTFDDEVEDIDGAQEYDSYFIAGYYIPGEAQRFSQAGYVSTLCEQQDADDSCFVQGVYDFAVNGNSGKWSQRQEIYTDFMEDRLLTWRKIKLRGKGRSIQLRYSSNGTKPFTIIGWSVSLSTEQAV